MMIGRNDPCPCGSGKKYKKCCGQEQVVDLQGVIDAELERIIEQFAEEGLEPKAYDEMTRRHRKWQNALADVFDDQLIELLAFESFFFMDRGDLWKDYIKKQKKRQRRQRVTDVLTVWEQPFYLLGKILRKQDGVFLIEDVVSGKSYELSGDEQADSGDWIFGIALEDPRKGEGGLQPTNSLIFIPKFREAVAETLAAKLEQGVDDSLDLYLSFGEHLHLPELPELQENALSMVVGFAADKKLNDQAIGMMAHSFLLEMPMNARKAEGVAAGILQAFNEIGFFDEYRITQQELARHFGVSVASLAKYREQMLDYLYEKFEEWQSETGQQSPAIIQEMGTDPRATERHLWEMLCRSLHADVSSPEELERMMQQEMNKEYKPQSDKEQAQQWCYMAYGTEGAERHRLAGQAFKLDPKNTDANLLLAEYEPDPLQKRLYYLQALNTGYRNFDAEFDPAWSYVANRPLLRALFSYGAWLMTQGDYPTAVEQFEDLLDKNPADHQGAKWLLLSAYLHAGQWEEADDFIVDFDELEETTLDFYFDWLFDLHDGHVTPVELRTMKKEAKELNPYVVKLIKAGRNPGAFPKKLNLQPGNEDEAQLVYWLIHDLPEIKAFV
ncbi:tetratricopeptide repeat protein [Planococcus lenghuensis]|uniref:Uncharacterized protein n=1 Tax=Planococcus lenghuensis TaxID=2213202 RepID=A0A1Q2KW28_9BACL|nr:SEC-C metal-binding domain-containing protein [Planococcus lenghuensis]AQQ52326.1 hypothetical protein B0X71_03845 [Planococcus lenghuensis]